MFFFKRLKKQTLDIDYTKLPDHIAIIMDGNGRWAKKRGLPRAFGHKEGSDRLKKISKFCDEIGIKYLTVYAFSTENWNRPKHEIDTLMALLLDYLKNADKHLEGRPIRIKVIGDQSALPKEVVEEISKVSKMTENNKGLTLSIALNYGGRQEIIRAAKKIVHKVQSGELSVNDINEDIVCKNLYTNDLPELDLLIRPGGETRISNFMLWQAAYTEIYYTEVLWPDFKENNLCNAIYEYQKRNRRFGGIN